MIADIGVFLKRAWCGQADQSISNGLPWFEEQVRPFGLQERNVFVSTGVNVRAVPGRYTMLFPIFASDEFAVIEGEARVGRRGCGELSLQVSSNAHDDNPLSSLRNAIVRRVYQIRHDSVKKSLLAFARHVDFLQPSTVISPVFVEFRENLGVAELVKNILEVIKKALSSQTLDVFEHEGLRLHDPNCPDSMRKHIPGVLVSQMLAAQ